MPKGGNLHINRPLTNLAVEYRNEAYIADQVMPFTQVSKESDLYYVFNNDAFIPEDSKRANGAETIRASWGVSTSSYVITEHALHDIITDRDRENADAPLQLDAQSTQVLTDKLLLKHEIETASLLFTTGTWSLGASVSAGWASLTTTVDVVGAVYTGDETIMQNSAKKANGMIIGQVTYNNLKQHPDITNRIQYVERGVRNPAVLSALFDIENIYVGRAVKNSNPEGLAASNAFVWGDHALIFYRAPNGGFKVPTYATHFGKRDMMQAKRWRKEDNGGDKIEVSMFKTPHAVATACAYLIQNTDA